MDLIPIQRLQQEVSETLKRLPGATALYIYGSSANPETQDQYSDLDLQVLTDNFALSRNDFPWILNEIDSISLVYPIRDAEQELAFCIAFEHESLYHKVDVGICATHNSNGFLQLIREKRLLWEQTGNQIEKHRLVGNTYLPATGSAAHFLVGEMISAVRYVKARKRGQHLTCWRFMSAKVNALLRCFDWSGDMDEFPNQPLSTWDFTRLDRCLSESTRQVLFGVLDFRTPASMDRAFVELNRILANRIYPGWMTASGQPGLLVKEYLAFVSAELAIDL